MDRFLQGTVSSVAFGGSGIVRDNGIVTFVPFTAPGDHITYHVITKKKNHAFGKLISVDTPSVLRTEPDCSYFGVCGGCQLQHMQYKAQLEYKRQQIIDALKRIGGISLNVPVIMTPSEKLWGYRRHITLHLREHEGHFSLGYISTDKQTLLPITQCPIFTQSSDLIIEHIQKVVFELKAVAGNTGRVILLKDGQENYILTFQFDIFPGNVEEVFKNAMGKYKKWAGLIYGKKKYGKTTLEYVIDDMRFFLSPEAFMQTNAEQSLNIYKELCQRICQLQPTQVLDLYCGVGISTLLLAKKGISIVGIEGNPVAIQLAQKNAQTNGLEGIEFHSGDVNKNLKNIFLRRKKWDVVVINPPRVGVEPQVIEFLLKHNPRDIFYISCMPSTLARDIAPLCAAGYSLNYIAAFDMFPQTAHIETMIHIHKS